MESSDRHRKMFKSPESDVEEGPTHTIDQNKKTLDPSPDLVFKYEYASSYFFFN